MSTANVQYARIESETVPSSFYTEVNFYPRAAALRVEFENAIASRPTSHAGVTPFIYAFNPTVYQFLTSSAEQIFTAELLQDLTEKLLSWASPKLAIQHISTPQARVYINGCSRTLMRDGVDAQWHYMLCLSPMRRRKSANVRVVTIPAVHSASPLLTVQRMLRFQLAFNQLLVTSTQCPYSIEVGRASMNPLDGYFFLDGYMW